MAAARAFAWTHWRAPARSRRLVIGERGRTARLGDHVYLRHAKAGELCERFDSLYLVRASRSSTRCHLPRRGPLRALGAAASLRCWLRRPHRAGQANVVVLITDDQRRLRPRTRAAHPRAAHWRGHRLRAGHRHLPALLPLAVDRADRPVRAQPRRDRTRARWAASTSSSTPTRCRSGSGRRLPHDARRALPERLRVRRRDPAGLERLVRLAPLGRVQLRALAREPDTGTWSSTPWPTTRASTSPTIRAARPAS